MYILLNKNKISIKKYTSIKDKFWGFMLKKNIKNSIYLKNTNSIHTFFMKEPIDVIFIKDTNIIKIYRNLLPNKIKYVKGANGVIELPKNSLKENNNIKIIL